MLQVFPGCSQRRFTVVLHGKYTVSLFCVAGAPVLLFLLLLFPTLHGHGLCCYRPFAPSFLSLQELWEGERHARHSLPKPPHNYAEWKAHHKWRRKPVGEAKKQGICWQLQTQVQFVPVDLLLVAGVEWLSASAWRGLRTWVGCDWQWECRDSTPSNWPRIWVCFLFQFCASYS